MASRNIQQINDLLRFIIRKQRNVFITIPEADQNLDAGQLDAFAEYFEGYGKTQTIHDALRPFRVYQPFGSDALGAVTFPSDYLHLLAGVYTVTGSTVNKVRFVETDEFPDAITSQLRPVTTAKPIAQDTNTGFQLWPQVQQNGFYNYLRRPATPHYDFTLSGPLGRTVTYNAGASTQIEFLDIYIDKIIAKTLKYFYIDMSEPEIAQFAEQLDKETP